MPKERTFDDCPKMDHPANVWGNRRGFTSSVLLHLHQEIKVFYPLKHKHQSVQGLVFNLFWRSLKTKFQCVLKKAGSSCSNAKTQHVAETIDESYSWHTSTSPKSNEYDWLAPTIHLFNLEPISLVCLIGWLLNWLANWLVDWLAGRFVGFSWRLRVSFYLHVWVAIQWLQVLTLASATFAHCWRKSLYFYRFAWQWSLYGFPQGVGAQSSQY